MSYNAEHDHASDPHKACVSLVPIFNHLEDTQLAEIMVTTQSVSYKKNELIYHAGDESDSLYIINKGRVRIYRLAESGKEQLVRFLNPGDFTGEMALFSESTHESYAEAVMDTTICMIKRADIQEFLLKYPSISLKVLAEFSNRLEASEKQATRFSTEKVETRIALFLVESLSEEKTGENELILPMSKKDLASYLGTTPETISRKFNELEDKGYIKQITHKIIRIQDVDGLLLV
ncbi:Crp/Fnr family transcriptional regulator [Marinilactibacillus psychrotolerans]|uniref:ArcR family transcriptional regulator n=1 Tax=Marinilactibacillus psychrotolerans TaxID=191770 RepID=A0AAV3WV73_9LACT|nr:Crp/Fnr family transcriptional regulator [Marinilactibacillus psychrotolerans]GEL67480.1 Crp/Fnr family transcriptional regulator [Marinilactibacillus psychrotolerans]GEQ35641.1 ArcR family transcriptional regulator [Marinilactibacillus psychrotolerans]SDC71742.1 CRP/FNR family transcriptional regulator, anaerobic regulatory protein [Marinilactibacillus psychrotolerans]